MMDAAGLTGPTWEAWRTFWREVYALPMDAADLERFTRHTGRSVLPPTPVREGWLIVGRRDGKSRMAAMAALFQGIRRDYTKLLAPGERGVIPVIAADRQQARSTLGYLKGLVRLPAFAPYVVKVLRDHVELRTGAETRVGTASFRTVRGYTLIGVVCEEISFWLSDQSGSNPDSEIPAALRPGMATVPGALLLGLSSPYAAKGELYLANAAAGALVLAGVVTKRPPRRHGVGRGGAGIASGMALRLAARHADGGMICSRSSVRRRAH
jgi:hypothetical protein